MKFETNKHKRDYIYRSYPKDYLFELVRLCYEDEEELCARLMACKTKKELLDKYLAECWECVAEEASYCC